MIFAERKERLMQKIAYMTPCVTAFHQNGSLDLEAQAAMYDHLLKGGVDGVLVLGSIGEFFAMSVEQRRELTAFSVRHIAGRIKVLIGTASMDFEEVVALSHDALAVGADAVAVISPYYMNLSNSDILNYYDELAKRIGGPMYLYNYPDRTGYNLSPEVVLEVRRRCANVLGIKDSGTVEHALEMIRIVKSVYPDFEVYCGFDDGFPKVVHAGGNGTIGGLSNVCPALIHEWVEALRSGNAAEEQRVSEVVERLMDLYNVGSPFIPQIKEAVRQTGVPIGPWCTFPISVATSENSEKIRKIIQNTGLTL